MKLALGWITKAPILISRRFLLFQLVEKFVSKVNVNSLAKPSFELFGKAPKHKQEMSQQKKRQLQ